MSYGGRLIWLIIIVTYVHGWLSVYELGQAVAQLGKCHGWALRVPTAFKEEYSLAVNLKATTTTTTKTITHTVNSTVGFQDVKFTDSSLIIIE